MGTFSSTETISRIQESRRFTVDDIEFIADTYKRVGHAPGSEWDRFRHCCMILPDWFRMDVDPLRGEYIIQQKRLWRELSGVEREYDPRMDEGCPEFIDRDAVRRPGFYGRNDICAINHMADQMFATGMIMKHSGLKAGAWALEYGAGFAQTALTLARMCVNVDTVDICPILCRHVKTQAEFYEVNLHPFNATFGSNPRGTQKYDLIFFFESFHHCLDFIEVIPAVKNFLNPEGKVLLTGEPITLPGNPYVPYPWGLRLEALVVAVIRAQRWFELGFQEDFICNLFTNFGFTARKHDCNVPVGITYEFTLRKDRIDLNSQWIPGAEERTWHALEPHGRWTTESSFLALDATDSFSELAINASNCHPTEQVLEIDYGGGQFAERFGPGVHRTLHIPAVSKSPKIHFTCKTRVPADDNPASRDQRALGIFMESIEYLS